MNDPISFLGNVYGLASVGGDLINIDRAAQVLPTQLLAILNERMQMQLVNEATQAQFLYYHCTESIWYDC